MLELNTPNTDNLVKDITEADFMTEVVEASKTTPIIVDFWAPWCGPCKTLGPALEAAVTAARGAVRMVKINVDENQQVAAQLRVQSIPTVYAFHNGQPVDGFQGALPQSQIDEFVARVVKAAGGDASGGLDEAIAAAEEMLADGQIADAQQVFQAVIEEDGENAAAFAGLARCFLETGDLDQAEAVLNGVPDAIHAAAAIEAAHAQLALARQAQSAGPLDDLAAAVAANPGDMQTRMDYATALHAAGQIEAAVDALLDMFRMDREWNDGAAKAQLFTIFDALKPTDPIVLNGRRKLSSMIFA